MILPVAVAATALLITYFYRLLSYKRFTQYAIFPQMPSSLLLGHLKHVDSFIRSGKPNGHPDLAFTAINEALGSPPLMFLDLRPFGPPMVIVRSHQVAEQLCKPFHGFPYGLPKMPSVYGHMENVTGRSSVLSASGEHWRRLRRQFNPGFAPQHLSTMLPIILERATTFSERLDSLVSSAQPFSLVELSGNLTLDIISSVVMDRHFGAQNIDDPSEFITNYRELFHTYTHEQVDLPWFLTPLTEWRRRRLAERIRGTLRPVVQEAFRNRQTGSAKSRSILSLGLKDIEVLNKDVVDEVVDQLKTFMFAGHDTTSILISWMIYELFRTPHALQAVRDEMDRRFGPDHKPSDVRAKLLSPGGADCLQRMPYSSAVIREALRLWPPAGTARMTVPGAGVTVKTPSGETYSLDGVHVYNCAIIIQRDAAVYGDSADYFVPERWIPGTEEHVEIPVTAWRAFERGPRNCIGQELATLEARIVLALVSKYDFVKHGKGELRLDNDGRPIMNKYRQFEVTEEMYPTRQVTPKPVDGMMMKVRR